RAGHVCAAATSHHRAARGAGPTVRTRHVTRGAAVDRMAGATVEVPIVSGRDVHEACGHVARWRGDPAATIIARAEPDATAAAPVPAAGEEDFLVVVLHDHHAGAHIDERRRHLEVNGWRRDSDLRGDDLRGGSASPQRQCNDHSLAEGAHDRSSLGSKESTLRTTRLPGPTS